MVNSRGGAKDLQGAIKKKKQQINKKKNQEIEIITVDRNFVLLRII